MMLTFSKQDFLVEIGEDFVTEIVVENQKEFLKIIETLVSQKECESEDIILSQDSKILKFNNYVETITSFVPFEINRKELLTKLYNHLKKTSVNDEMYEKTVRILSEVENYIYELTEDFDEGIFVTSPADISGFLKTFEVKFEANSQSLAENLFDYAQILRKHLLKSVFISVNLRSYLLDDECEMLYKTLTDHKICWVCLESSERPKLDYSNRVILDKDLCLI